MVVMLWQRFEYYCHVLLIKKPTKIKLRKMLILSKYVNPAKRFPANYTVQLIIAEDNTVCRVSFRRGGRGGICPLLNPVPPLEFVLHTPTLHGAPPNILNRPLCPRLQKLLDETLVCIIIHILCREAHQCSWPMSFPCREQCGPSSLSSPSQSISHHHRCILLGSLYIYCSFIKGMSLYNY